MPIQTAADSISNSAGSPYGFKNRIINGAMVIDQRNAGASVTPTNVSVTLDRWVCLVSQASKYTVQQNAGSVTPPVGFTNYLGVTSSSAYSITSSDYFGIRHNIEGLNVGDLAWGTVNAQTVTLSFWVRSSLTGTFGGAIQNSAQDRSYPFTYTISTANTWEQKTITIAGDKSGTWLVTNGIGIQINFGFGVGSTFSGTAGAWAASSIIFSATGATSVVGTNGATFYITGVQVEKGSQATAFDYRPFGTELQLCERYYEVSGRAIDSATWAYYSMAAVISQSTNYVCGKQFATQKRTAPTVTIYSRNGTINGISAFNTGSDVAGTWVINAVGAQGFHAVQGGTVTKGDGYEYGYTASAEL